MMNGKEVEDNGDDYVKMMMMIIMRAVRMLTKMKIPKSRAFELTINISETATFSCFKRLILSSNVMFPVFRVT